MTGTYNTAAHGVSFYTPAQNPPAGTATEKQYDDNKPVPTLFQPMTIRGVTFQNKIFVSPMCQYSAENGFVTPWHMAHLGGIISRGPSLAFTEAAAIVPEGRITPEDAGIWSDEHAAKWAPIVEFAHSQNQKIGIQLAHAGRKSSTIAPWITTAHGLCPADAGGWPDDVWAPSAIAFAENYPQPKELTIEGIKKLVEAHKQAAIRAISVGFDVIEIHGAHGYLTSTFLSPSSNKRTDEYGGSFENRIRFALEVTDAVRSVMPDTMPLVFRVSGSEGVESTLPDEPSWRSEDTVRLAPILAAHGVDILDVSAGGINRKQKFTMGPAYQSHLAHAVKKSNPGLLVATVGGISTGSIAQGVLDEGKADMVLVARAFQQNPGLVFAFAQDLDVSIHLPHQMARGFNRIHKKP